MNLVHIHLMLNHLPIIAMPVTLVFLGYGVLKRNESVQRLALAVLVVLALMMFPIHQTGEESVEIAKRLPGVTERLIENHDRAAALSMMLTLITGALAGAALMIPKKKNYGELAVRAVIFVALAATLSLAYTSNLGGQIRHTEIRSAK